MARKPNAMPNGGGGGGWKAMNESMAANRAKLMTEPNLHGSDLFGDSVEKKHTSKLGDEFLIPPFTVLSAREGWWQERKRAWLSLGIQSELGRGENLASMGGAIERREAIKRGEGSRDIASRGGKDLATPGGSKMPATDYSKSKARGDGRGRAITG